MESAGRASSVGVRHEERRERVEECVGRASSDGVRREERRKCVKSAGRPACREGRRKGGGGNALEEHKEDKNKAPNVVKDCLMSQLAMRI